MRKINLKWVKENPELAGRLAVEAVGWMPQHLIPDYVFGEHAESYRRWIYSNGWSHINCASLAINLNEIHELEQAVIAKVGRSHYGWRVANVLNIHFETEDMRDITALITANAVARLTACLLALGVEIPKGEKENSE